MPVDSLVLKMKMQFEEQMMISKQSTEEDKDCVRPDLSKLVKVREIGCRQRTITCRMLKNVKVLMVLSQS